MSHDYLTVNGQLKFASEVVGYYPGTMNGTRSYSNYKDTNHILGKPNSPEYGDLLTLGIGGEVYLYYENGFLDSSGKNDIYVYEGADEREPVDVYVSVSGDQWEKVGTAKGGRGIVSIEDSDDADTSKRYYYIALVENGGNPSYPSGADIDAVGVMNY